MIDRYKDRSVFSPIKTEIKISPNKHRKSANPPFISPPKSTTNIINRPSPEMKNLRGKLFTSPMTRVKNNKTAVNRSAIKDAVLFEFNRKVEKKASREGEESRNSLSKISKHKSLFLESSSRKIEKINSIYLNKATLSNTNSTLTENSYIKHASIGTNRTNISKKQLQSTKSKVTSTILTRSHKTKNQSPINTNSRIVSKRIAKSASMTHYNSIKRKSSLIETPNRKVDNKTVNTPKSSNIRKRNSSLQSSNKPKTVEPKKRSILELDQVTPQNILIKTRSYSALTGRLVSK